MINIGNISESQRNLVAFGLWKRENPKATESLHSTVYFQINSDNTPLAQDLRIKTL